VGGGAENGTKKENTMDPEILFETRGAAGLITLNRPKALNALNLAMVSAMRAQLKTWAADPAVSCVVIRGAGERAFCAGGDIRAIAKAGLEGSSYGVDFWREEYILNAEIKHYPKPFVALIHGICMGGGIGVSVHGAYRLTDPSALFAMPETGIGFFPDIGGSFILSRAPGETGLYMGLTGARIGLSDALYAGLATHCLPTEQWPALIETLAKGAGPGAAIAQAAKAAPAAPQLAGHRARIDRLFAQASVEDILAALDTDSSPFARETTAVLRRRSPTSLKLAFREIRNGRELAFDACMQMEFRMASRILAGRDFYEGVRAVLNDKDNDPHWQPATLPDVSGAMIDAYFAPLPGNELPVETRE
jgi:enoyl-CoA hydratase